MVSIINNITRNTNYSNMTIVESGAVEYLLDTLPLATLSKADTELYHTTCRTVTKAVIGRNKNDIFNVVSRSRNNLLID